MGEAGPGPRDESPRGEASDARLPAVQAERVTKVFGAGQDRVVALDDVTLPIRQNEFFTLLGPSGCGKTTLLRLIAGFERPDRGEILLEGEAITALPPFKRPVNTVFQNYALFPHLSVAENIGFGLSMRKRPKAEIEAAVAEMLALVRLEGLAGRRTAQLSGGQQQRVALARALANHPKVLLLDEPLSALDFKLRKEMQLELKRLQRETGITFVFVTHDQEEAITMSDRLAVMSAGKVQQVGAPHEIYEAPVNRFVADFIGESNFMVARIVEAASGSLLCSLEGGQQLRVPGEGAQGEKVTLALRPEKVGLTPAARDGRDNGAFVGTVREQIYQGTTTAYHIALAGGGRLVARDANREDGTAAFARGDMVSVALPVAALRVLRD